MSKNHCVLIVGLWITVLPFLGFPSNIKTLFVIVGGIAIVLLAFLMARDKRRNPLLNKRSSATDVYVENSVIDDHGTLQ